MVYKLRGKKDSFIENIVQIAKYQVKTCSILLVLTKHERDTGAHVTLVVLVDKVVERLHEVEVDGRADTGKAVLEPKDHVQLLAHEPRDRVRVLRHRQRLSSDPAREVVKNKKSSS